MKRNRRRKRAVQTTKIRILTTSNLLVVLELSKSVVRTRIDEEVKDQKRKTRGRDASGAERADCEVQKKSRARCETRKSRAFVLPSSLAQAAILISAAVVMDVVV